MTNSVPLKRKRRARRRPSHLILAIEATLYTVQPSACDPTVASRVSRLMKSDGSSYNVAETSHGPRCDCPDFIYRRDGLDPTGCKHIQALVHHGLIENRDLDRPL